jgi:hypothetical protein
MRMGIVEGGLRHVAAPSYSGAEFDWHFNAVYLSKLHFVGLSAKSGWPDTGGMT